jgi:hypothetical protein
MKWLYEIFKNTTPVFVEIRGRESVLAQGYCRVEQYLPESIVLSCGEYSVAINGSCLELRHLSEEAVAVDGRIDSVEFL